MAGSNFTSPTNEHGGSGYSDFNQDNSYQRSHSVGGNLSSGMGHQSNTNDNDWGWQDSPKKQMPSSKSYNNQFSNNLQGAGTHNNDNDDDWSGFDSYQDSSSSYQNSTTTSKNMKLSTAATTQKLSEGFDSLDVKSAKPKTTSSNNKSAEDDAWNLLMN